MIEVLFEECASSGIDVNVSIVLEHLVSDYIPVNDMVMVWSAVCIVVLVEFGVGVGTLVRIPPLGRLVTVLLLLNVMNSCESARMNRVQLPPVRHTDRPAGTIRMEMNQFEGISGGREPFQNFGLVFTKCKSNPKRRRNRQRQ